MIDICINCRGENIMDLEEEKKNLCNKIEKFCEEFVEKYPSVETKLIIIRKKKPFVKKVILEEIKISFLETKK